MGSPLLSLASAPTLADPVTDPDDILSVEAEATLDAQLRALRGATGVQGSILTVSKVRPGHTIETFAMKTASSWGGGSEGQDDGFLVVLAVWDRRSRIEAGHGLEGHVTDAEVGRMLMGVTPYLRAERYDLALE